MRTGATGCDWLGPAGSVGRGFLNRAWRFESSRGHPSDRRDRGLRRSCRGDRKSHISSHETASRRRAGPVGIKIGRPAGGSVTDLHTLDKRIGPDRRDNRSDPPSPNRPPPTDLAYAEHGNPASATQPAKEQPTIFTPSISASGPTDATTDPIPRPRTDHDRPTSRTRHGDPASATQGTSASRSIWSSYLPISASLPPSATKLNSSRLSTAGWTDPGGTAPVRGTPPPPSKPADPGPPGGAQDTCRSNYQLAPHRSCRFGADPSSPLTATRPVWGWRGQPSRWPVAGTLPPLRHASERSRTSRQGLP